MQTPKLYISDLGLDLLNRCLAYDPLRRISADKALLHGWFKEEPLPKPSHAFPQWKSRAEQMERKRDRADYYESTKEMNETKDKRYKLL